MDFSNKTILKFVIYWILSFSVIIYLSYTFRSEIRDIQVDLSKKWFDNFINHEYQKLQRYVEVKPEDTDKIHYNIAKPNSEDLTQSDIKTVEIDVMDGSLIAFSIGLTFCFAVPIRISKKVKFLVIMFIAMFLLNGGKYLAMVYDNYNHPEFVLSDDLPFIFDEIVYASNWFLSKTGSISANVVIPVLFWILILISDAEIRKIFNSN